jgi:Protein of unknown function (DUF3309)
MYPGERPIVLGNEHGHFLDMLTLLLIVLVLLAIGSAPAWPHSRGWGYYPSGGIGLIVLILVILAVTGRVNL